MRSLCLILATRELKVSINSNSPALSLPHTVSLPSLITGSINLIFKDCAQRIFSPFLSASNVKQQHIFTSLHTNIPGLLHFSFLEEQSVWNSRTQSRGHDFQTSAFQKSGIPLEWPLNNRAAPPPLQDLFLSLIPEL